jgi:hypothetical protein
MLSNKQKASIHIAKNERGISDPDYRALLKELTGAISSTDPRLGDKEYQDIMKALNNVPSEAKEPLKKADATPEGDVRPGWKESQLKKFRQYVRLCKMDMGEARQLLYRSVGAMNEESPDLKQVDFDDVMAAIETELETRVKAGTSSVPEYIHLQYWRQRHPNKGAVNTRESHKIFELWNELKAYLGEEKRTAQYLLGFAAHVCCFTHSKAIEDLSAREALKVIDALRKRIIQEQKRAAKVPF